MSETNGSPVTRAELAAHIKGIDEHFDIVEAAVLRIELKLDGRQNQTRARWQAWGPPVVASLISFGSAVFIALYFAG